MGLYAVTGAASGIGAATTSRLRADGHRVITADLTGMDVTADLGTAEGRSSAVAAITTMSAGVLDGVVTCAGIPGLPSREGAAVVSVNYFGTVEVLLGLQPLLAAGEQAAVVALSSNATTCQPGYDRAVVDACLAGDEARARELASDPIGAYPASKLAVAHWVRTQAVTPAWIGSGIRLNALAPGMVETPFTQEVRADPLLGRAIDAFPIPRGAPGRPDEIAAAVCFLLSAQYAVGTVLFIDGGTDALLRPTAWPAPPG